MFFIYISSSNKLILNLLFSFFRYAAPMHSGKVFKIQRTLLVQQEMFLGREMLWIMDNAVSEWSEIMHECSYVEAARPQYTLQNMSECTVIYSRVPDNREKWNSGVFL